MNFEIDSHYFVRFFIIYFHNLTLTLLKIREMFLIDWFRFQLNYFDIPLLSRLASSDILLLKILHLFVVFPNHFGQNF